MLPGPAEGADRISCTLRVATELRRVRSHPSTAPVAPAYLSPNRRRCWGRGRGACSPCQDAHANMRAPHGLAPYIRCMPHKDARDVSLLKHVHVALDWAVPEGLQCCPRGWSVHQHSRGACSGCALLGSPELLFHQLNYVLCAPAGQGHLLPPPIRGRGRRRAGCGPCPAMHGPSQKQWPCLHAQLLYGGWHCRQIL